MNRTRERSRRRRGRTAAIIGGGIAGLSTAILLAKRGHRAIVLERDRRPAAASPEEAFRVWERAGVPQFRHSHVFLARITAALRERFPEVLRLLQRNGALELPLTVATPPGLDLGARAKGDGELVLLGCRRAAFEWALRRVAVETHGVELREGVLVEGLRAETGAGQPPRVIGVELRELGDDAGAPPSARSRRGASPAGARPRRIDADLVIDASGRRSPAPQWLARIGANTPRETSVPTGIFYFTRFYRLIGPRPPGTATGLVAGDLGWIKLATFPGDGDTFSITVGTGIDDEPFRALADPEVFEAIVRAFPQVGAWRAPGVSRPIDGQDTPVLVMGGLSNRRRRFLHEGRPLARGFFPVGDAVYHSNPIYGRGATSAVLAAIALDDALAARPEDLSAAASDYDRRIRLEIEPFWDAAAAGDRMGAARAEAARASGWLPGAADLKAFLDPGRTLARLLGRAVSIYFAHGLVPASRRDGEVYRAVMRVMNMLDAPRDGLLAPQVVARVMPFLVESLIRGTETSFAGPSREEAIALIAAVDGRRRAVRPGAKRRKTALLEPESDVAGHA